MRFFTITAFLFISLGVTAQCVPNLTGPNFQAEPDTIVNLPTAYFPSSYETTIQMYIPTDTFVAALNLSLPLDSLFITGITGLPVSFDYEVFPSAGPILGGSPACLQITNPIVYSEEEGEHQLLIHVTAWSVGIPAHGDITGYILNVEPHLVGIFDVNTDIILSNVVSKHLELNQTFNKEIIEILDMQGRTVIEQRLDGLQLKIDVSFLPVGIYFIQTSIGSAKFLKIDQ